VTAAAARCGWSGWAATTASSHAWPLVSLLPGLERAGQQQSLRNRVLDHRPEVHSPATNVSTHGGCRWCYWQLLEHAKVPHYAVDDLAGGDWWNSGCSPRSAAEMASSTIDQTPPPPGRQQDAAAQLDPGHRSLGVKVTRVAAGATSCPSPGVQQAMEDADERRFAEKAGAGCALKACGEAEVNAPKAGPRRSAARCRSPGQAAGRCWPRPGPWRPAKLARLIDSSPVRLRSPCASLLAATGSPWEKSSATPKGGRRADGWIPRARLLCITALRGLQQGVSGPGTSPPGVQQASARQPPLSAPSP